MVVKTPRGWRLEFPIGKKLFEGEAFPYRPRFSPKGDEILLSSNFESLLLVDPKTGNRSEILKGPVSGYGWSTTSDEIWLTRVVGSTTEIVAFKMGGPARIIGTLPGNFLLHDIDRSGRILAERILGRTQMIGKASGEARERDLSWLSESRAMDISADGKTVLFSESAGDARAGVYVRPMDGSPAVRLGDGGAVALSPDGKWALSRAQETVLLPTGPGTPRTISSPGIEFEEGAAYAPDGKRLFLSGKEKDRPLRLYSIDIAGGIARPVTPEGVYLPYGWHSLSPDGKFVAAVKPEDGTWSLYPLDGDAIATPRVGGRSPEEEVIRWSADGRSLFVRAAVGGNLSRLDLASGRRELLKEFPDTSALHVTPDGRGYVYELGKDYSNLWLIDGLGVGSSR